MKRFFKYKFKPLAAVCLLLSTLLLLPSCSYKDKLVPCEEIVRAMTDIEIGLPAGKIYSASAREGEDGYIPDSLLNSLFGEGGRIPLFDGWLDYSFFMPSSAHPCEIVVILCDTPVTADDTARLLYRRLGTIKTVKGNDNSKASSPTASSDISDRDFDRDSDRDFDRDSERAAYLDTAEVTVCRNYVLLIISADTAAAKKCALAMIG